MTLKKLFGVSSISASSKAVRICQKNWAVSLLFPIYLGTRSLRSAGIFRVGLEFAITKEFSHEEENFSCSSLKGS
ncbi:hypothetical protein HI914_00933 [Erysiphe necator]|nr:hypothetical protein HI914_00933 [Erysiphe necator]